MKSRDSCLRRQGSQRSQARPEQTKKERYGDRISTLRYLFRIAFSLQPNYDILPLSMKVSHSNRGSGAQFPTIISSSAEEREAIFGAADAMIFMFKSCVVVRCLCYSLRLWCESLAELRMKEKLFSLRFVDTAYPFQIRGEIYTHYSIRPERGTQTHKTLWASCCV